MTNSEKYIKAFVDSFNIDQDVVPTLEYQSIDSWDSVGHMGLMATLEEVFDIVLEIEDIVDFSSFDKGKEIIAKYNVAI